MFIDIKFGSVKIGYRFSLNLRSQTEIAGRYSLSKIRKIFGSHSHIDVKHVFFPQIVSCPLLCRAYKIRIVIHKRITMVDKYVCRCSVCFCRFFGYAMNESVCLFSPSLIKRPDDTFQFNLRRYYVCSSLCNKFAYGKGCGHCGICISADDCLKGYHNVRCRNNRVNVQLGSCSMPSSASYLYIYLIG